MPEPGDQSLLSRCKRWRLVKWASFVVLAGAIALALQASVSRLQNTIDMIDSGSAGDLEYKRMTEGATLRTVIGLGVGCAAMLSYMVSAVLHQRSRSALRDFREEQRRSSLAELIDEVDRPSED